MNAKTLFEKDIRELVSCNDETLEVIERAFVALTKGDVTMPPIQRMDFPEANGEIDTKTAYIKGAETFTVKMSTGFFDNPNKGLPSGSGLMLVFSSTTGWLQNILLDNGYLTDVRTGLAGAVAAKHLSRRDSDRVGVVGAGKQAFYQLECLELVRPMKEIRIFSLDESMGQQLVQKLSDYTQATILQVSTIAEAAEGTDILVTTTPAKEPIIMPEMLAPGMHITAMGSDAEDKNEILKECFKKIDIAACDSADQCFRLGELHHSGLKREAAYELGQIISGATKGREHADQITFCDLTGTGAQDAAISACALKG